MVGRQEAREPTLRPTLRFQKKKRRQRVTLPAPAEQGLSPAYLSSAPCMVLLPQSVSIFTLSTQKSSPEPPYLFDTRRRTWVRSEMNGVMTYERSCQLSL